MAIIETVLEKKFADGKPFWIAVIDGKEIPCYDPIIKEHKGKENPFEIATSAAGKQFLKVPKQGGFKGGGGFQKGKSELEIKAQVLTMCMSYAKDNHIKRQDLSDIMLPDIDIINTYKLMSQAVLTDLAKITMEAPKTADSPPQKPVQETSPEKAKYVPPEGNLTVKQKLEKKMWTYLQRLHSDTDDNFKTLLRELTEFTGKDEKPVYVDNLEKLSEKWAATAMGKLEKLIDEEERRAIAEDKDNPY